MTTAPAIRESLARCGLDPMPDTPEAAEAPVESPPAIPEAIQATHAVVVSGEVLRLVLTVGDEPAAIIVLGPADALALACDLLVASRPGVGR